MTVTHELSVCTECLLIAANGCESEKDDARADAMVAKWGDLASAIIPAIHTHDEWCEDPNGDTGACECQSLGFRMSDCDACGDPLGGDRHQAVILQSTPSV